MHIYEGASSLMVMYEENGRAQFLDTTFEQLIHWYKT